MKLIHLCFLRPEATNGEHPFSQHPTPKKPETGNTAMDEGERFSFVSFFKLTKCRANIQRKKI